MEGYTFEGLDVSVIGVDIFNSCVADSCSQGAGFQQFLNLAQVASLLSLGKPGDKRPGQLHEAAWLPLISGDESCAAIDLIKCPPEP